MEKAKVLIIEDETIVAHDLDDMLTQWGYEVVGTASSGEEAVEKAQATNPNLVLADIKLEGAMDGIEASELIRSISEAAIVYLTARTDSDLFDRAKETQPYGYLTKPVSPQELLRTVEMALYKHKMEQRLKESETRFRAIFDQTFQFIGLMTTEGVLIEANQASLDLYGLSDSDVIGFPFWETPWWTHSADIQETLRKAIKKAAAGEFVRFEAFHPTPDGELHYVDVSIKPVKDDQGNVSLLIPEGRDITERRLTEDALRLSEERYRTIFENIQDVYFETLLDGTIVEISPSIGRISGYRPDDLIGTSVLDIYADPKQLEEIIRIALEHGSVNDHELLLKDKDGTSVPCSITSRPIYSDEGRPYKFSGALRDISDRKKAEKAVSESEHRYRQLTQNSLTGIYILQDDKFVYANERLGEIMGYRPEEVLGRKYGDFLHSNDVDKVKRIGQARALNGSAPSQYEFRIKRKNGETKWLEAFITTIDYRGRPATMGNVADISERKQAEEALQESDEFNRSLVEHSPMAIVSFSEGGIIEYTNPASNRIFGVPEGHESPLLGFKIFDLPLIAEQPYHLESFQRLMQGEPISELEIAYRSPFTGHDYVLLASATPRVGSHGSVTGSIAMFMDISERKRVEKELEKLAAVIRYSSELVNLATVDGKMIFLNEAGGRMLGIEPEAAGEHSILEVIPEGLLAKVQGELLTELMGGRTWEGELQYRNIKTGNLTDVHAMCFAIKDPDTEAPLFFANVSRDITDRKHLETQLREAQKMEAVGTLAGGLAHDFNNLLQIILGYSDMLLMGKDKEASDRQGLLAIRRAARDGSDLVKGLLTFSRKVGIKPRPINLNDEVNRVRELLSRTIPKMIEIELFLAGGLKTVNADPGQIEQVLLNLSINARDAMPEGGTLTIETENVNLSREYCQTHLEVEGGEYALLTVSDNGHGMDHGVLEHIFEPFFTTKEPDKGTGLGLAAVFGIVKNHKGHITCHSEPGKGTTFKIYLPVVDAVTQPDVAMTTEMPVFGTETILLVDDEDQIRDLGKEMLGTAGYKVLTANDGKAALEIYRKKKLDISLVILDLIMPEMDGRECLDEILRIDPAAKVMIASGYAADGQIDSAMEEGARAFIHKPYELSQLLETVRSVLHEELT